MRCVLLDDDKDYGTELIKELENRFPQLHDQIELVLTEREFRERLDSPDGFEAKCFIIDMMIHWTDPSDPELPPADEVEGGYYRAGVRCLVLVKEKYPDAFVILQSALTSEKIKSVLNAKGISETEVNIVRKKGADLSDLFQAIIKAMA